METPAWRGGHCWDTFEEFQKSVCSQPWYHPDGQMVVIEQASGEWVAMSAITRFEGNADAYNLFTGVDRRFRGRKLAQAVKVKALRFARDVLKSQGVRTNHNTFNEPMIAIDRKFGYEIVPGYFVMEKKTGKLA
jgi:RimJ/RimL family protein N-acetyltransferase